MKRLDSKGFPFQHEHFSYEDAGRSFNEHYMMGGTEEENKKPEWIRIRRFLSFWRDCRNSYFVGEPLRTFGAPPL
jgi:uncharacterized protein YfbU (UPF0304 family)